MAKLFIEDLDLPGKRVIMRVDFNVPVKDGKVENDKRLRASLPSIQYVLGKGASLVLMSHLGRPDGQKVAKYSLKPVAEKLAELLGKPVKFLDDCVGPEVEKACAALAPGEVALLENLRFHIEEEGKVKKEDGTSVKADPEAVKAFRASLSKLGDVYVNDAFGTAHRAEGTTYGIAQFAPIACAGPLLAAEIDAITKALAHPKRPLVAIVAGSKVSTKLTILKSLSANVDQLIVGGGIANTFLLAAGLKIGKSLAEPDLVDQAKAVIEAMKARGAEVPIPTDVVTAKTFSADAKAEIKAATDVADDDLILDIGPDTAKKLAAQLKAAGTIVWNGPVGVFEFAAFENGTKVIAQAIAESDAFSIAGGGDTLAAIAKYGIEKDVGYISTGGGAFLEVLEGKTLPALEILTRRAAG